MTGWEWPSHEQCVAPDTLATWIGWSDADIMGH
jgi:hypothetical protein